MKIKKAGGSTWFSAFKVFTGVLMIILGAVGFFDGSFSVLTTMVCFGVGILIWCEVELTRIADKLWES